MIGPLVERATGGWSGRRASSGRNGFRRVNCLHPSMQQKTFKYCANPWRHQSNQRVRFTTMVANMERHLLRQCACCSRRSIGA